MELFRRDLGVHQRWPALEGLRGIAIIGVVGYHVLRILAGPGAWADHFPEPLWWLAAGRLGVDLLFVLSGFLVYRSWNSIRRKHGSGPGAVGEYAVRRGQRVYPAYWLSLLVFIPWLAPELLDPANWRHLLLFVSGMSYWVRGLPDQVNTVYWTLTTELCFYVALPVIAIGLRRRPWLVYLPCALLSFAWVWEHGELDWLRGDLPAGFIGGRLDQFVIGAVAAELLIREEAGRPGRTVSALRHPAVPWIALAGILWGSQIQGSLLGTARDDWVAAALHPGLALCFAAIVVHLTGRPSPRALHRGWLRLVALISYSIYLWHFPLLVEGLEAADLAGAGLSRVSATAVVVGGLLVVILVVSGASYLLAERPAMRARARRSEPLTTPPP